MLDYEIICYKVEFLRKGAVVNFDRTFYTEESAVDFIKTNRAKWEEYRLLKIEVAVSDF